MAKKKRETSLTAPLGWTPVNYDSWDEWFADQKDWVRKTGMSYDSIVPPKDLLDKLGPMPVPPWLRS